MGVGGWGVGMKRGCVQEAYPKVLQLGGNGPMSNLRDYMKGGLLQNTGGRDGAARVDIQDVFLLHTVRPYGIGRNRRLGQSCRKCGTRRVHAIHSELHGEREFIILGKGWSPVGGNSSPQTLAK